jgi:predicted nucleic acid-binding Zn ribbon protein
MAIIPRPFQAYKLGPPRADSRRRVLTMWRGVDVEPLEKARADRSKRAGDLLPGVLKELRMDRRQAEAEILKVWNEALDPTTVEHAQPTGLNKGTLFVAVDSSAWLSEIVRYRRREILTRLQHSFGLDLIKRISFRTG